MRLKIDFSNMSSLKFPLDYILSGGSHEICDVSFLVRFLKTITLPHITDIFVKIIPFPQDHE